MTMCVYALYFKDGSVYIGQTTNLERRFKEHKYYDKNLSTNKDLAIRKNGGFDCKILFEPDANLSYYEKLKLIRQKEQEIIHKLAKDIYNKITHQNTNFKSYTKYGDILSKYIINKILY